MAGTDGGGGSMDYEYNSHSMSDSHTDSMRSGGRISRCPALAHGSWSPFNAAHYYGQGYTGWQHGHYNTNHLTGYNSTQQMPLGYTANLPARVPSLPPIPLPEPRGSHSSHPSVPAPAVYSPSRYGVSRPDPSPHLTTTTDMASSPGATSASTDSTADYQVSPSRLSPSHTRAHLGSAVESSRPDAPSSSSPPSSGPASQSRPTTTINSAQQEGQSPSVRPPTSQSTARVRLPAPGNTRQRMAPNDQRLAMTLGHYARYRDVADYLEMAEYEAAQAAASQTSDDDSDREFGSRPYSVGHAYLQTARQSQILRGQMNNKRVASRKAVQSLQKVDLDSLPDTEKTCVICYNDFGVASPEGTVETPLRLPKCKHVFGNQCILKWLEESYSCPYCRDKLESEIARPDQDSIRRLLTDPELANLPPSLRHRVYRTQTSDRAEARAEGQSLLRARQRELDTSRDRISRGERRAAPPEDSNDAQRRQRPRFSADGFNPDTTTASTQNPSPAQRTPAWQHGATAGNNWALAPQYAGAGASPTGHLAHQYSLPSFAMPNLGFPHDLTAPSYPPIFSREDYYHGPRHSESPHVRFDVSRPGAAHEYTLPQPSHPFSRHTHSAGDPFNYASHQQNSQQASPFMNMAQGVGSDVQSQGNAYSSFPNRT